MLYTQFNPHPALADYIDAFWTAAGDRKQLIAEKILPDGCVDIIFNAGSDCKTDNGEVTLKNGGAYLVGTMTRFKNTNMNPETKLLGIRFKPAAFSAFYKFCSLHTLTDQTIEFEKALAPDLQKTINHSTAYLNHFFLNRLSKPKHTLISIVADIQNHKGQTNVNELATRHFTTIRQLERNFKQHIGSSPAAFINLVRYQFALSAIENKSARRTLSDIAFDYGYYDHPHLTNEIKRYTGVTPSQF
jgi:AraC-like DNA-binding protein